MSDHLVHDAVGGPLTALQAAASIAVGANCLMVIGVQPVLLGALADTHRLTEAGIGRVAMTELLSMGVATALAGILLKPNRLPLIGVLATLALALINFASIGAQGGAIQALRLVAGVAEGVMLWITVGMIARTVTPERWAGVFYTVQVVSQLLLAFAFSATVLPDFGADGGFAALGVICLVGLIPAFGLPPRYAPLPKPEGETGAPPLRGWVALIATAIYVSAAGAVSIYLQPLAHAAGLSSEVARTALWVGLAGQALGAATATLLAGRVKYFTVFVATSVVSMGAWWVYGGQPTAVLFIGVSAVAGVFVLFLAPFLTPFTIDADPSRRAAVQSGAAQLLGGAMGPWLASFVVQDHDVMRVLLLGVALQAVGLAIIAALRFSKRRSLTTAA